MVDGPLPEHFEPHEAPVKNLFNGAGGNPCARFTEDPSVLRGSSKDYPYVVTTYSVVEHWQSGTQTRNIPWLNELIPSNFIELSEELAKEKGIRPGDKVRVWNNRGSVVVDAMITIRMKPMTIDGKLTHVVGMPHHFSWATKLATRRQRETTSRPTSVTRTRTFRNTRRSLSTLRRQPDGVPMEMNDGKY